MKPTTFLYCFALLICTNAIAVAQDSLITALAKNNVSTFSKAQNEFSGEGWEKIIQQAGASDYVLIGEDHFTNEIPFFVSSMASRIQFGNFFCEIDPYSANMIEDKIKTLSKPQLDQYIAEYGNTFSFFALDPEFRLLEQMVRSNADILGTDQILLIADRLICNELQKQTKNREARKIYAAIADSSKVYFDRFLSNPGSPFYMLTDEFEQRLNRLSALQLSAKETEIIQSLRLSARIYKEQNHHLRIQLMKNELMKAYPQWSYKKSLFKYGGFHLAKGESLLKIFDIGNLVHNIADSQFKTTLHIMILGKSGTQGSPFKGFPEQIVDENSDNLKFLKPIYRAVEGENWHCFDMRPLLRAMEEGRLQVNDISLERVIKGYDLVVIIPTVTASRFAE